MKLTDFFKSSVNTTEGKGTVGETKASSTENLSAKSISKQIQALTPGKMIQGEVVEKNGNEVKIKLTDDIILTARLDQDVNVEAGKILTFEVKNNGSTLSLSPLFANTATQDNVFKALQMANLPVNNSTIAMTESMMQQGMSIDAKSLQTMFKDVVAFHQTDVKNIVELHKLALPVNETNVSQMENYRALTHELVKGMTQIVNELPEGFATVLTSSGPKDAVQMMQDIIATFLPGESIPETEKGMPLEVVTGEDVLKGAAMPEKMPVSEEKPTPIPVETNTQIPVSETLKTQLVTALLSEPESVELSTMLSQVMGEDNLEEPIAQTVRQLVEGLKEGSVKGNEVLQVLSKIPTANSEVTAALTRIMESEPFLKLMKQEIGKQWTIEDMESLDGKKVEEVYRKLDSQLSALKESLSNNGAAQTLVMKSVTGLSQNLDFMNQLNQMFTYVQLPLKLNDRQANGELYVYTNKRTLAQKEGSLSALLHLDMEHLGPVDVYIAMEHDKVNTRFTVADDEMLDFLNDHIDILTKRLSEKGYHLKCEMTVREDMEAPESPIDRILKKDGENTLLAQYGFDVRA